ncbi:AAA family ATPase [Sneathiella sp. P13V-1]|uniref:ExeA family protein n=1 Tax=Sneathiella sp. P13V-1 TaxID=2697366 RepID=UPI00187B88AC|nr:AAA family ATPase [Sneathiella sp. P13V-1]MBE7636404.1 AAA family ATPase [Sneathiella sp. P13V-1]
MYEEFYGLENKPFSIQPDPDFLYWGRTHSMAYAMLEYGVMNHAGFTVITGEIGCGKTTLIRHLLNRLADEYTVGLVSNIQGGELLQWVLSAFDQPYDGLSQVALHDRLQDFLIEQYALGKRTILIVDEAQNLGPKLLEQLRLLSNINADSDQLLQLILVGQPQLKDLLQSPELIQFAQRVASDFHVVPLSLEDVKDYIKHRLEVAGRHEPLFTDVACEHIHEASRGVPRIINILCDTCLVYGFAQMSEEIDSSIVDEVIEDKKEHGVFKLGESVSAPKTAPIEIRESEEEAALIIRDKDLAKMLLEKLQG